jgi:hypothetical protein
MGQNLDKAITTDNHPREHQQFGQPVGNEVILEMTNRFMIYKFTTKTLATIHQRLLLADTKIVFVIVKNGERSFRWQVLF